MRGLACSAEFMRRFERLAKEAGWSGNGAVKKPVVQALEHHFCLGQRQVYDLLKSIEVRTSAGLRLTATGDTVHPTILVQASRAKEEAPAVARLAVERGWTSKQVAQEVKRRRLKNVPPLPKGTFRVLYADPPWQFSNSGFDQAAARAYPTMSTPEIAVLDVGDRAARDSVCFLWVPAALLQDGLTVLSAWGFSYKTGMVWVKNRAPGMGWFFKSLHEHVLFGVRGSPPPPKAMPPSVVQAPVRRHSEKPAAVMERIEAMYDGPYLELFARSQRDGWKGWGTDVS